MTGYLAGARVAPLSVLLDDHRLVAVERPARLEANPSPAHPFGEDLTSPTRATWPSDLDVVARQGEKAIQIAGIQRLVPGADD